MNKKVSVDGSEVPSIIEEIVIYDKPNKLSVPQEIFPKSTNFDLVKGDIVLSRAKEKTAANSSKANESKCKPSKIFRGVTVKNEVLDTEEIVQSESGNESVIETPKGTAYEILYEYTEDDSSEQEESIENISKEISKTDVNCSFPRIEEPRNVTKAKNVVSSSKEDAQAIKKSKVKAISNKNQDDITSLKKIKLNKETAKTSPGKAPKEDKASPFKKPRGRPKKLSTSPQKSTLLNFLSKQPTDNPQVPNEQLTDTLLVSNESTEKVKTIHIIQNNKLDNCKKEIISENIDSNANEAFVETNEISPPDSNTMVEPRQKRVRRRPKKFDDHEVLVGGSLLGQNLDEEIATQAAPSSLKKKKYAELTMVPLYNEDILNGTEETSDLMISTDHLDELLDEAQEQVRALDEAETELQTLVESNVLKEFSNPKKSAEKGLNKSSVKRMKKADQPKTTNLLKDIKQESGEKDDELLNVSHEEYESDEDSRKEWVPEEYAEYKQQHVMKQVPKMHPCKFCGHMFNSYYALRKHRALEHDDVGKDWKESSYQPSTAVVENAQEEDAISDEESRGEWMPQDYADYKMKHTMSKAKRSQWYKCKICCAVFSNYYKLTKHRVEHEKKANPYECKECNDRFRDVDSLAAHIRVHQGKDPYNCKKCGKGFSSKEELVTHYSVHVLKKPPAPEKRFRCDLCRKEFSKLCDVERHTRVHTGEKPCECNICHKRFQQSHNLSKHLLTHLHVKPFQCEICNKKFGRVDVLNRHLLTHSMEKPYKCDFCAKGFIRDAQLAHHMEKFHPADCLTDETLSLTGLDTMTDEVTVTPIL